MTARQGPMERHYETSTYVDREPWATAANRRFSVMLALGAVDGVSEVEIGYRLAKEYWGKGLASEAGRGVVAHGFDTLGLGSNVGIVAPRHELSIRVLEKIDFRDFSETRYSGWDVRVYRLSRNEQKPYNTPLQPTSALGPPLA